MYTDMHCVDPKRTHSPHLPAVPGGSAAEA
jgi:hypothetical protein